MRRGPPHTSAGTSREEGLSRGFHPYRPEDDLHRAAAAAAAALPPYALDPAYAAYHPAFLQHHAFQSAAALRFVLTWLSLVCALMCLFRKKQLAVLFGLLSSII